MDSRTDEMSSGLGLPPASPLASVRLIAEREGLDVTV